MPAPTTTSQAVHVRRAAGPRPLAPARERRRRRESSVSHGDVVLDILARRATVDGREVELSAREFALAEQFLRNPGRVLSREQLLSRVWGLDFDPGSNVVDVYVRYLRGKLGAAPHRDRPRRRLPLGVSDPPSRARRSPRCWGTPGAGKRPGWGMPAVVNRVSLGERAIGPLFDPDDDPDWLASGRSCPLGRNVCRFGASASGPRSARGPAGRRGSSRASRASFASRRLDPGVDRARRSSRRCSRPRDARASQRPGCRRPRPRAGSSTARRGLGRRCRMRSCEAGDVLGIGRGHRLGLDDGAPAPGLPAGSPTGVGEATWRVAAADGTTTGRDPTGAPAASARATELVMATAQTTATLADDGGHATDRESRPTIHASPLISGARIRASSIVTDRDEHEEADAHETLLMLKGRDAASRPCSGRSDRHVRFRRARPPRAGR